MTDNFNPVKFERHWISYLPHFLFSGIFFVFSLYITAYYEWAIVVIPVNTGDGEFSIRIPFLLVIFIVLIIRPLVKLLDSDFEVASHHLRVTRGRLSIRKNVQEFAYEDLLGVEVSQSILGRILGYGDIKIGSKTSSIEVTMGGIKNPDYYASVIARRIDASRIEAKPNH